MMLRAVARSVCMRSRIIWRLGSDYKCNGKHGVLNASVPAFFRVLPWLARLGSLTAPSRGRLLWSAKSASNKGCCILRLKLSKNIMYLAHYSAGFFFLPAVFFFAAFFLVTFFLAAVFFAGFSAGAFFVAAFLPKRPRRTGAAASSSWHCSSVRVFGSVSFGTLAFFSPSVMYGP